MTSTTFPELVELSQYGGDWDQYIEAVYQIFLETLVQGKLTFLGMPITCPYHPASNNKHFVFWHLISEDQNNSGTEEQRIPDLRRCERIMWIPHVLKNAMDSKLVWCWEKSVKTKRGKKNHVVLYLHKKQYLVILRRKSNRFELVTSFIKRNPEKFLKERNNHEDPRKSRGRD